MSRQEGQGVIFRNAVLGIDILMIAQKDIIREGSEMVIDVVMMMVGMITRIGMWLWFTIIKIKGTVPILRLVSLARK